MASLPRKRGESFLEGNSPRLRGRLATEFYFRGDRKMAADGNPQFQSGDVVQLISGGPKLSVAGLASDKSMPNFVVCFWFDATGKLNSEAIPARLLRKVDRE